MLLSGYFPNENIRNFALCVNAAVGLAYNSPSSVTEVRQFKPFSLAGV